MKKLTVFCAVALMLLSSVNAKAEGFLIKGGMAFQNVNTALDAVKAVDLASPKGRIGWCAGLGYQTSTWGGFSLQPEILYRAKSFQLAAALTDPININATLSYIEVPVNVQWGVDLLFLRPFVFASPYVGFKLGDKIDSKGLAYVADAFKAATKKVSGGVGLGVGIEISKLQITAKYNWDFGGVANWSEYWEKMGSQVKDLKTKEGAFEIGLAIIF
ncbi:MAG: outer membrane beta-barrel protein [Bacteroidales bacterium]|nr:outer membrane beta-barrel protein [Candidatus Cacconaster scatequi]